MARAEAYLRAKFHLDPSNRLVTVRQRYRQIDIRQTGQRSDSIGRTVLQTVAQKVILICCFIIYVCHFQTLLEIKTLRKK